MAFFSILRSCLYLFERKNKRSLQCTSANDIWIDSGIFFASIASRFSIFLISSASSSTSFCSSADSNYFSYSSQFIISISLYWSYVEMYSNRGSRAFSNISLMLYYRSQSHLFSIMCIFLYKGSDASITGFS